jgi:fructose-1,6-bisphosphatase
MELPYDVSHPRGRYLLLFNPLDGSPHSDVAGTVGTIFSVLSVHEDVKSPAPKNFFQPGTEQVCAGYALYGPSSVLVVTMGRGVHGFTLDREIGAYRLTHPHMRIPGDAREFAINMSNARFWKSPIQRYVDECVKGLSGPREADFSVHSIASLVAEVHRILVRGGLFLCPDDTRNPVSFHPRLLYEANPLAFLVEQAGGCASTGRKRVLEVVPSSLHEQVPVILGSRHEVQRIERYCREYETGEDVPLKSPLFNIRSLFRMA